MSAYPILNCVYLHLVVSGASSKLVASTGETGFGPRFRIPEIFVFHDTKIASGGIALNEHNPGFLDPVPLNDRPSDASVVILESQARISCLAPDQKQPRPFFPALREEKLAFTIQDIFHRRKAFSRSFRLSLSR